MQTANDDARRTNKKKRARGVRATYQTQTVNGCTAEQEHEPKPMRRAKANHKDTNTKAKATKKKQQRQCKSDATQRLSSLEKSVDRAERARQRQREKERESQ